MKRQRMRALPFLVVPAMAAVMMLSMGASNDAARVSNLSQQLMCVCGCNEILGNCNHESCPDSPVMLAELRKDVGNGMNDRAIFQAFQAEYGATVLAAPMLTRFNVVAWVMPPLLLVLGIFGVMVLVRKWRLRSAPVPAPVNVQQFDELRDRIRKETDL
jgi:cytochrome c-type biogenesis protein CcmH/NrfF